VHVDVFAGVRYVLPFSGRFEQSSIDLSSFSQLLTKIVSQYFKRLKTVEQGPSSKADTQSWEGIFKTVQYDSNDFPILSVLLSEDACTRAIPFATAVADDLGFAGQYNSRNINVPTMVTIFKLSRPTMGGGGGSVDPCRHVRTTRRGRSSALSCIVSGLSISDNFFSRSLRL
jgi:hypothetical protein